MSFQDQFSEEKPLPLDLNICQNSIMAGPKGLMKRIFTFKNKAEVGAKVCGMIQICRFVIFCAGCGPALPSGVNKV